ncbi:MAG TPA: ABC transporter permease [Opitutaceae bacterium]|nr:ABC transporter permease [Opitutaceae bacterium]
MSQVRILLRKSLLSFWRAKAAVYITFLVPIVLIYLFGHVFGLYRKDSGPTGIPIAVVNLSREPAAQKLIDALKAEKAFAVITTFDLGKGATRPLTEADVRAGLHDNWYRYALILPADLLPDNGFGVRMKFLFNPRNEIESQMVNGLLQKTVFSNVPQLLGLSLQKNARRFLGAERFERFNRTIADTVADNFGGDREKIYQKAITGDLGFSDPSPAAGKPEPATPPDLRRLDQSDQKSPGRSQTASSLAQPTEDRGAGRRTAEATAAPPLASNREPNTENQKSADIFSRMVKIETEQVAGKELKNPMASRLVGGYAIMFLLFAVSGSATTLFEEKNSGVFQRLLSSPVRPAHILWARFLFGVILGLVQITALFCAGRVFFGLDIFHHAGALLAVSLSAAAACSAFGMLIAAIAPSAAAANGIATFVVISMSAVGGAWFPVSFMPDYIQRVSKFTLVYWSVEGFADVLWAGRSLLEVLPKVGILAGIAAAVMVVAVWCFNRGKLFD